MTNTEENSTETNTLLTMEEVIGGGKEDSMTNLWEEDGKFVSRGDKGEEMTKNKAESAKNINIWVVGGQQFGWDTLQEVPEPAGGGQEV